MIAAIIVAAIVVVILLWPPSIPPDCRAKHNHVVACQFAKDHGLPPPPPFKEN